MISRALAWAACAFALLLPSRARALYAELLGWWVQFLYLTYYGILNYLLRELRRAESHER